VQISIQPLVDLLLYHRQGGYNLFRDIVEQWLGLYRDSTHCSINITYIAYDILSNLTALGFIDTYNQRGIYKWTSIYAAAVNFGEDRYMLFVSKFILDGIPKNKLYNKDIFSVRQSESAFINLTIPSVDGLSYLENISKIKPDFNHLVELLPKVRDAVEDKNICALIPELSMEMELQKYNFLNNSWGSPEDFTNSRLYKQNQRYGPVRYFIVEKYFEKLIYEVLDLEWVYILAYELLQKNITIHVNLSLKEGRILPRHFHLLPSLLKRALIADSLSFPMYRDGELILIDCDIEHLDKLSNKIKSLKIIKDS